MSLIFEAEQYLQKVQYCENCQSSQALEVVELTESHLEPEEHFVVFCSACTQVYRRTVDSKAKRPKKLEFRSVEDFLDSL